MSRKGTQKATHHTLSLPLCLKTPEAPAALGAGGMPVFCELGVEVGVPVLLSVEPATIALEASGVGLEMGEAEPREADGLYENGGEVGNSLLKGDDDVEGVAVTVERVEDAEPTADDDDKPKAVVDVEVGKSADVDEDVGGSEATVVVVAGELESMSEGDGSGEAD